MLFTSKVCPAMAVPIMVKMPEPITAPMPRAVSATGPSVFLRRCSGRSESAISLSMDLRAKSWRRSGVRVGGSAVGRCNKGPLEAPAARLQKDFHCWLTGDRSPTLGVELALCGATRHLLNFALLRAPRIIAGLLGIGLFALFARLALGFFAFFSGQGFGIHDPRLFS